MSLVEKQQHFMKLLPRLLDKAHDLGFEVTGGELERSQAAADANAAAGVGIRNSLHLLRLAIDLHLFKDLDGDGLPEYLIDSEDYRELGEWWEAQSTPEAECCWGGRFTRADGNHFSVSHNGVK